MNGVVDARGTENTALAALYAAMATSRKAKQDEVFDEQFQFLDQDGNAICNLPFTVRLQTGEIIKGYTDDEGKTGRYVTVSPQSIEAYVGHA